MARNTDNEESMPEKYRLENKELFDVDDKKVALHGIKKRLDVGTFVFAKTTSPWTVFVKMDNPHQLTPLNIVSNHVRNGQLTWRPARGQPPPSGWQLLPEFPTAEELLSEEPAKIPPNDTRPETKHQYLETQYRLYRFEGIELLRRAIAAYRVRPKTQSLDYHVYTQVHVRGYFFSKLGAACRVSFSTEMSDTRVVWEQSSRLTPGTLVALSTSKNMFQTLCRVAVVAGRQLVGGLIPDPKAGENQYTPPRIDLFWADAENAVIDPAEEMVMVEASGGYYETVRHAMVGLQHAALHVSKFDKYLIDGSRVDSNAEYRDVLEPVVPPSAHDLDESQREAFHRMTSAELAIVQGPPGTGKTFTSIVAVKSLVDTFAQCREATERPPIIVSAQTNHALDQLLAQCITCDVNIVRLGGRTQDECIEERSLYNLRKQSKVTRRNVAQDKSRMRVFHGFEDCLKICFPPELISAEVLFAQEIINEAQFESLKNDEWETADDAQPVGAMGEEHDLPGTLVDQWLDQQIEKDLTYVYRPPQSQAEPARADLPEEMVPERDAARNDSQDQVDDDEKDRLHGIFVPIELHWTGALPDASRRNATWTSKAAQLLRDKEDLYEINPAHRGMVYRYMRQQLIAKTSKQVPEILRQYRAACENLKVYQWENSVKVIQHERVQVIGCTTTGLTKYRGLLAALKPKVLLIEEAAETREPNITSAMFPTLDQLILVGDHQQLVPHVDVRELEFAPYNLSISLFERLVRLGLPYTQLQCQRRMIPAIREVVQTFYPELRDHAVVKHPGSRPPVPGMKHNLWWFQHSWPDERTKTMSFINIEEAKMIVGFAQYLVQNGIQPSQITILTFYTGQVDAITDLLSKNSWFRLYHQGHRWSECVRTVDGFQGEQNEVILLSATRSRLPSERANAGFVENENRAVVALSRAKRGLYLFGNAQNLLRSTERSKDTWGKVFNVFRSGEQTGYFLPVVCQNHGNMTKVGDPEGWHRIWGGGCKQPCRQACANNHPCQVPCHAVEQSRLFCQRPCEKTLPCGHACMSYCSEACKCFHLCDAPKVGTPSPSKGQYRKPRRNNPWPKSSRMPKDGGSKAGTNAFKPSINAARLPIQNTTPSEPLTTGQAGSSRHTESPHLTSEQLMGLNYRAQFCDGTEHPHPAATTGQASRVEPHSQPVIRETFRRTVTTGHGSRVVVSNEVNQNDQGGTGGAEGEEALIDLREVVCEDSSQTGRGSVSSKGGTFLNFLIDIDQAPPRHVEDLL